MACVCVWGGGGGGGMVVLVVSVGRMGVPVTKKMFNLLNLN